MLLVGKSLPPRPAAAVALLYLVLLLGGAVGNDCCSDFVSGNDFIEMLNPRQALRNVTCSYVLEVITPH